MGLNPFGSTEWNPLGTVLPTYVGLNPISIREIQTQIGSFTHLRGFESADKTYRIAKAERFTHLRGFESFLDRV